MKGRGWSENYHFEHMAKAAPLKMPEGYWADFREEVKRALKEEEPEPIPQVVDQKDRLIQVIVERHVRTGSTYDKAIVECRQVISKMYEGARINEAALEQAVLRQFKIEQNEAIRKKGVDLSGVDEKEVSGPNEEYFDPKTGNTYSSRYLDDDPFGD